MVFDELFDDIQQGKIDKVEAKKRFSLNWLQTAQNYIADVNREARTNIPEIIYGEYKTFEQTLEVAQALLKQHSRALISRSPHNNKLAQSFAQMEVHESEHLLIVGDLPPAKGGVLVISAGAADHPIVAEAELTLKGIGVQPFVFEDRGISHPTRVLEAIQEGIKQNVAAVVVIAGMEGALAPFVASLVGLPVIGVPTSVGYGFKAKEAALTSMLASCAPNLSVVNIDGGLRGAVVAGLIAKNQVSQHK